MAFSYKNIRKSKTLVADGINYTMLFSQNTEDINGSITMFKPKNNFHFGNKEMKDLIMKTHKDDIEDNIIGHEILEYYDIVLDFPRNKIYSKQLKNKYEFGDYYSFGFGYTVVDNKIVVKFVWDDSPAYKSNIKKGMQILQINNINLENLNSSSNLEDISIKLHSAVYESNSVNIKLKELPNEINLDIEALMKLTN